VFEHAGAARGPVPSAVSGATTCPRSDDRRGRRPHTGSGYEAMPSWSPAIPGRPTDEENGAPGTPERGRIRVPGAAQGSWAPPRPYPERGLNKPSHFGVAAVCRPYGTHGWRDTGVPTTEVVGSFLSSLRDSKWTRRQSRLLLSLNGPESGRARSTRLTRGPSQRAVSRQPPWCESGLSCCYGTRLAPLKIMEELP